MSDAAVTAAEQPVTEEASRGPGIGGTLVRGAVSLGLLAFVASRIDLAAVGAALVELDWGWMAGAVLTVYVAILVSAVKWGLLLRARGYRLSLGRLTRHYLVGLFFNNFLPTSVGGDVVRAWDAGKDLEDTPEGAASVIAERLIASVGLGLTAALGLLFIRVAPQVYAAVGVVFLGSIALAVVFLVPSISDRICRGFAGGRFEDAAEWAARTASAVGETLRDARTVAVVLALSIAFQALVAAVNWFLFYALGSPVSFVQCLIATSIVSAVTMVPISISGHGVREAGYAYFFAFAGVGSAVAVTASVLFFVTVAVCTLPGAVFFAAGRRRQS
ncbi:MAG: lysylphosphatidylglycerol synthase transmembrane domain-containing protein [Coriobacteriia bacterium]